MKNKDVLKYLRHKAPMIEWKIEEDKIRGSILLKRKKLTALVPFSANQLILDDYVRAFNEDYERKKDGTKAN